MDPFVFIVGCARSGTTLLQRMLDAHPLLAILPEMHWITSPFKKGRWFAHRCVVQAEAVRQLTEHEMFPQLEISADDFVRCAGAGKPVRCGKFLGKLFALYSQARGKPLVGSKTPAYVRRLGTLHTLWPAVRFVHLIRDGRAVCLSVLNWDHAARAAGRYAAWSEDPVVTTALWWRRKVKLGQEGGRRLGSELYYELRYESLVRQPAAECAKLCAFLGLPYDEAMVRFHDSRQRIDSPGHPWLPIMPGLRNWRTQMPLEDIERFEAAAGDLLDELSYPRAVREPRSQVLAHASRIRVLFTQDTCSRRELLPESW